MDLGGRAIAAERREVEAGENVEGLDEGDASGGGRRRGEDVVGLAVGGVVAGQDRAVDGLVAGEVGRGEQPAVGVHEVGQLLGHFAVVELIRVGDDALKGVGEVGLAEGLACLVEFAVAIEDALRFGELGQIAAVEGAGFPFGKDEAFLREPDGGGHVLCEGELAEALLRVDEALDRAGDADGLVAEGGEAGYDFAGGVEIHVGRGCAGGALAEVEEVGGGGALPVSGPVLGHADEHEASSAEIAGARVGDGQGEADGDCGVDGVAALLEDGEAGVRGVVLDADDHGVASGLGALLSRKGETWQQGQRGQGAERHRGRTSVPRRIRQPFAAAKSAASPPVLGYFTVTVSA